MFRRVGNMVWKEALQFWRYRLLLVFILLFPVLDLFGVSQAVSAEISHIPMAVYDQDRSAASRRLVEMLRASRLFDPDYFVGSQAELEQLLRDGKVRAGLLIPPDLEADLSRGQKVVVGALLDGSETATSAVAEACLQAASFVYSQRLAGSGEVSMQAARPEAVDARSRIWFNEDLRRENFQIPAEMTALVAWLAVLLPAVAVVRERERGTIEMLFVTPLRSLELIVSTGLLAGGITFLGFLEALAIATLVLQVPLRGSAGLLLGLGAFYILVEMGWGLVISAAVKTQGQAFLAAFFWMMLESILSGQILPVENMPAAVQSIARLLPNTHFTAIVRGIMLRGSALADLWPSVAALGMAGIVLYALAATRLRKRLD